MSAPEFVYKATIRDTGSGPKVEVHAFPIIGTNSAGDCWVLGKAEDGTASLGPPVPKDAEGAKHWGYAYSKADALRTLVADALETRRDAALGLDEARARYEAAERARLEEERRERA